MSPKTPVLSVILGLAFAAPAFAGERYALLVSVQDYPASSELRSLKYADRDVDGLAEALKAGGYGQLNVRVMTRAEGARDVNRLPLKDNIVHQLKLLLGEESGGKYEAGLVGREDSILLAFAGHGVQFSDDKECYFCPLDARLGNKNKLLSLSQVYEMLKACPARFRVLLTDACRNDPFLSASRSPANDLEIRSGGQKIRLESSTRPQSVAPPQGVVAVFGCSAGEEAFEADPLRHGVFFHHVIEGLSGAADLDRDKLVTLPELLQYAGLRVNRYATSTFSRKQRPEVVGRFNVFDPIVELKPKLVLEGSRPGEEWSDNSLGMKFCWCPPGSFTMGSPKDEPDRSDDEDQVRVTLSKGFWLGKYEVTQSEYERVMGTNPSWFSSAGGGKAKVTSMSTVRFPVEEMSWEDASEFCRKLTSQERRAGKLPAGWKYDLPTEAQWEYACRAGTTTATAFGSTLSSTQANFAGNYPYNGASDGPYLKRTCTVGSYDGNRWGLHDLHGNVWEWCRDWYLEELPGGRDPEVTTTQEHRVLRGGSWGYLGFVCRSAYRSGNAPVYRNGNGGFRVARVPE